MMSEYIDLLMNINLLFFSISYAWAFSRITELPYLFRKRINAIENIFSMKKNKSSHNKQVENKEQVIVSLWFFILLISFTILMVSYFIMFYQFALNNYDDRLWYVFRLVCTPFIFLILPLFLPSMLHNFFSGFFPKETDNFDRKSIKSHKFSFAFDWIWILGLLTVLTLFLSWEVNIIWLAFLVVSLVLLLIVAKLLSTKRSKVV